MRTFTRRAFLHHAGLATLAGAGAGAGQAGPVGERLRVAVIGVRGRGLAHVNALAGRHNCIVTTVCDVDRDVIGPALKIAEQAQGRRPRYEPDLRRVIDDRSIDVVTIATPNHWHALAALWALQNGKDVYVEKPVSHNVCEGRRLVEAARKYGRVCQAGMQIRSMPGIRAAMRFLHAGGLGKITLARGLCYKPRGPIGRTHGPQEIPDSVDYDLWCGPAPKGPLRRTNLHYDWHWFWDFGNGDLGNQGIHQMDVARWGLGKDELPRAVLGLGGRFGHPDDGQTPNTQMCVFDYGDCELIFEVRGLRTKPLLGAAIGNVFYGSAGYLVCPTYETATAFRPDGTVLRTFDGSGDHFGNFIQAVRSRKVADLNADVEQGHLSSALCHLGNISYRLGTEQPFDAKKNALGDDQAAAETFTRLADHLKDNRLRLEASRYRLGRRLAVVPRREAFAGDAEADALLTRPYRKGFEVPERV